MVNTGRIVSVLWLIRWPNLFIVAATQVLMRECIMVPLLKMANMEVQLSPLLFSLLVFSTVLITAGGYAINDYFDRKIDVINKPDNLVVGVTVFPRHAMAWHLALTITGVMLGSFVSIRTGQAYLSLTFFMASGLLWFYSTTYKRQLLLGNVMIALLTGLVPFIVLVFELPLLTREYGSPFHDISRYVGLWVSGFAFFAFMVNLVREIVKDAQDYEGDRIYGKNTIPVAWGTKAAQRISVTLVVLTIVLLYYAWARFIRDYFTLIYFSAAIVIPLIFVIYILMRGDNKSSYRSANMILKIVMVTGMGYAIVANLIVNNFVK